MTVARAIEYRITRKLLQPQQSVASYPSTQFAERLIAVLAGVGGLLLCGSLFPELVIAALAGSLVWCLAGN